MKKTLSILLILCIALGALNFSVVAGNGNFVPAADSTFGSSNFSWSTLSGGILKETDNPVGPGKVLCYSGDTNTCDTLALFAKNADLFLCDACFTDALWNSTLPHLSARKAAQVARASGVKRLMLTHFRPDISKETLLKEAETVFKNVCLAQVGLKAEV